ncbi:MAG: DMSO/TMAO reductase YedYZ, molybdopterin-dependent catalytic subunit [Chloroflexi bacterium]|nr:MAG: DMSO/TMAO reductase YedYZ, molybdopterin-dependent catalytic subunit [Chloroflexota bacterium]
MPAAPGSTTAKAIRLIGPGAVGALGALALWLLLVQESDAPFLGTLIVDATSSVLSPSGFSRVLDIVGQAGKAVTLASTIVLQFLLFIVLWAWGTQYLPAQAGWRERWPFAAIQVGIAFALLVIFAAIFDLTAVSSVFDGGDWANYLWQTLLFSSLFVGVAHALDRLAAAPVRADAAAIDAAIQATPVDPPVWDGGATPVSATDDGASAPVRARATTPRSRPLLEHSATRRGFLALAGGLGVFVTAAVFVGRVVADTAETGVRRTFAGMLPPPVTPNEAFYTVSKNFFDPTVDGDSWRLRIDGLVETPLEFTLDEILAFPAAESMNTLMCISYELGDELISNARWVGTSLQTVLDRAGVLPEATHIQFTSADDYVESHSVLYVQDPRVRLVWEMNAEPLPHKHGFPLRLLAPGRYGIKNPKWITRITLIDGNIQGYWQQRGWSQEGFIQTMSRIDVPPQGGRRAAGQTLVQGIAFAGDRGIDRVEVSTDDGATWTDAEVEDPFAPLAWRFWSFTFDAAAATHILRVRATDGSGAVQTAEENPPLPNGSTGYHRRELRTTPTT